ncbi:hypothetical protein WA026_005770 [Henosepilachna vigintioctopunctata]|uniref:ATPase inhibitor n=1 Tax=Henosepilachna vigintioctopunctata TaxID=420089 RepID=A0AAW1TW07_9CUCU
MFYSKLMPISIAQRLWLRSIGDVTKPSNQNEPTSMKKTEKQQIEQQETDENFKKEQKLRMDILKENLQEEINYHEGEMKRHKEAADHFKKEIDELKA